MPLARSSGGPSIEKQLRHTMLIRRNADSQGDSRLCSGNRARPARCGSGSPSRNRPASGRARPASIQPKCAERPLDSTVYSAFAAHIQPKPAPSSRDRRHAAESTRGGGVGWTAPWHLGNRAKTGRGRGRIGGAAGRKSCRARAAVGGALAVNTSFTRLPGAPRADWLTSATRARIARRRSRPPGGR